MLRPRLRLILLGLAAAVLTVVGVRVGVPSAALSAALVVGLAYALGSRLPLAVPRRLTLGAQGVVGVVAGSALQVQTLQAIGQHWLSVSLVTVATLVVSLGAGLVVARITELDQPTASLGLVAGGASGIVAVASDLGADARLVAFLQYLRVLVVVVVAPLAVHLFPAGMSVGASALSDPGLGWDLLYTVGCAVGGIVLARLVRFSSGTVLFPLALAAVLAGTGLSQGATVPGPLEDAALVVIGLQVALGFTRATIRQVGRLLPVAFGSVIALIVACALLGVVLSVTADVPLTDAYLATTPGGLYAVIAAGAGAGADLTFVVAVQTLRVLAMLVLAPLLVRFLARRTT